MRPCKGIVLIAGERANDGQPKLIFVGFKSNLQILCTGDSYGATTQINNFIELVTIQKYLGAFCHERP